MPTPKSDDFVSKTSSDGTVVIEGDRGTARMSRLAPGMLSYVCSGYFPATYAQPMIAVADREMRFHGSVVMITDAWELSSVDSGYREAWTAWFKAHKQSFRMTLLVRSKLMEMAASLANLFTGLSVVTTYSKVPDWERAVRRDVPGFQRTSPAA